MAEGEFIFEDGATIEATFQMNVAEADHNALFNRDIPNQHPISAITDLQTTLDGISGDISAETTRAEGVEGSLSNLTTENKTNLVSAINEVDSHADTNASNLANHINDKSNPHEVTKAQVELGNVDNTSDLDKPISTATQTALNGKQNNLSQAQLNAVNSGIDSTKVAQIATNAENITSLQSGKADKATTLAGYGITNAYTKTEVDNALSGKQNSLDTAQMAAVNSGITQALVTQIGTNQNNITTINGKIPSDASSSNQLADKSYVDTADGGLQTQITANAGDIDTIEGKIPSAASSSNQLADKNFVNSSISTNTATFIGTFNSVEELEAYSGTLTNNDYAFVIVTDSIGNTAYDRYKYTTATTPASWLFEYELNNSSFTADQWAAINSGANTTNIGQIATNTSAISGLNTSKQDKIDSSHKLDSDLVDDSGQTNKFVTASEKSQITTNANDISSIQSGKADKATTLAGYGITNAYTKTEVDTIASGKQDNLTTAQLNAVNSGITSAKVSQYDGYATSKANVGLDNLNADGQMIIDSVDGKISNCILEIPQNLKVSIVNNVVTLDIGSIVTLFGNSYSTYTTTTTKTWATSEYDGRYMLFATISADGYIYGTAISKIYSGTTYPVSPIFGDLFFDTSDRSIHRYTTQWVNWGVGYPIAIVDVTSGVPTFAKDSNGNDMIFNGAGFIGHHAFVLPNISGLLTDRFNTDGTLKSTHIKNTSLLIEELDNNSTNAPLCCSSSFALYKRPKYIEVENMAEAESYGESAFYYIKDENVVMSWAGIGGKYYSFLRLLSYSTVNNVVTNFTIRQPVRSATNEMLDEQIKIEIGNRTRKDIGTLVSNGTLSRAVAEQNLEKYGISIGDYFTGASGYEYTVADMDTFYGGSVARALVNTHHVCLVVNTKQNTLWNYSPAITANGIKFTYDSAGTGYYAWKHDSDYVYTAVRQPVRNSTKAYSDTTLETEYATVTGIDNTTSGGYVASNLHSYLTGTALPNIQSDLGSSHLVSHDKLFTTVVDTSRYNRYGQNSGASSNNAWSNTQYISALSEAQVYGTITWSSSGYDTGEAYKQLDVFRKYCANEIFGNHQVWLRDVGNSYHSAFLNSSGYGASYNTTDEHYAAGIIMYK